MPTRLVGIAQNRKFDQFFFVKNARAGFLEKKYEEKNKVLDVLQILRFC